MAASRHIDKICIAGIALLLVVTILFMNGAALGVNAAEKTMQYEKTLFDTSYVHQIDIVLNDGDAFIEDCEDEEYAACTVVIDGEKHSNIAIRAKGNTSLSNVKSMDSDRYSFKLEFDHYEEGKTLDGLDKLCLNNLIQDNTMMKDYIVYQMMAQFGANSPLCSFAYLTVNGEDWGLYLAVESVEDSFLERNYDSEGELYKPDSMSFGGGRGNGKDFNMDDFDFEDMEDFAEKAKDAFAQMPDGEMPQMPGDFTPQQDAGQSAASEESGTQSGENSEHSHSQMPGGGGGMGSDDVKLKYIDDDADSYGNIFDNAKTEVSESDEKRLISALKNLSAYTELEDTVDTDEVLRYFVVHNFVCNGDSYTGSMIHNYYLHEQDGKLDMIPWDYNLAFGTFQGGSADSSVNASIDSPVSGGDVDDRPMLGWIFSDESYTEQYHTLFAEFTDTWCSSGKLTQMIADTADMIRPYVEKDPTKFCTTEEFEAGVTALNRFVTLRAEAVSRQLAGDTTAVDTTGLTVSDMGTMGGGMGGGDRERPENAQMPQKQTETSGTENAEDEKTEPLAADSSDALEVTFLAAGDTQTDAAQMPDGAMPQGDNGGTPPQKPDGEEGMPMGDMQPPEGAQAPEMGEKPTEQTAPGAQAATEVPETETAPETETEAESAEASDDASRTESAQDGSHKNMPQGMGDMDFAMPGAEAADNTANQWLYVAVSAAVLLIGIFIAVKIKH